MTVGDGRALPSIHQRYAPKLAKINIFNRPIEISFTSFLQQEIEKEVTGEDNMRFRSDLSENGKVLTIDIGVLATALDEKNTKKGK